ncbi:uncharacterized protein LOC143363986 [Halictus rubicundus]|uniref:uncharacterized protein LOC143363986 n=1 Tax=Halictus rubicundus TaxID=77578 RepID=UPI004036F0CE
MGFRLVHLLLWQGVLLRKILLGLHGYGELSSLRASRTTKFTDAPPSIKNSPVPDSSSGIVIFIRGAGASLMRVSLRSGRILGDLLSFRSSCRLYGERDRSLKISLIPRTNLANLANLVGIADYGDDSCRISRRARKSRRSLATSVSKIANQLTYQVTYKLNTITATIRNKLPQGAKTLMPDATGLFLDSRMPEQKQSKTAPGQCRILKTNFLPITFSTRNAKHFKPRP